MEQHSKTLSPSRQNAAGKLAALGALLLAVFLFSFCIGRYGVPLNQVVRVLLYRLGAALGGLLDRLPGVDVGPLFPLEVTWTGQMETVVMQIRLPRIIMACLVGCCLAAAGSTYQGIFQNPMASPDILGASSGAAFGAALAILLGGRSQAVTASAFFFSILTVALVYLLAARAPGKRVLNLVLAGIMVSSLFTSATSYIKLVADPTNQLPEITYWLMGSLSATKTADVAYVIFPMALGLVPLFLLRWRINLLTLGDEEARTMGIHTNRLRLILALCATLVTAASISVSGMIGWVGLVVPHLGRRLVGNDYRALMPASMLFGAVFLLAVDNVSRNLLATEIPIGILTAFIGAPFFLYLMMRKGGFR
ncbi:iron ABC transporter permease [uncultured Intestinimonas sp.]|uniref:FecCD family ABC transporter permease n=1 Tax=uncultured Intestinimonas sp. TaxID=1689265 RepID=UPI0025FFAB2A|nr:iron ABC transporter permease [uncultured Intestinimonas sp.]